MPCPADALEQRRNRARRANLDDEVDAADVDAQLERRGGDERFELAPLQSLFGFEPLLARQAAVMARDAIAADPFREVHRETLGEAPSVHEHQRRAMLRDQLSDPGVDLFPDLRDMTASSGDDGISS